MWPGGDGVTTNEWSNANDGDFLPAAMLAVVNSACVGVMENRDNGRYISWEIGVWSVSQWCEDAMIISKR